MQLKHLANVSGEKMPNSAREDENYKQRFLCALPRDSQNSDFQIF